MGEVSGWILLDKPSGITSKRASFMVARMFGAISFGHLGTLDPLATGLLPIAFGQATKMIPYIETRDTKYEKEYLFSVVWGYSTDTLDITGKEEKRDDKIPKLRDVKNALTGFHGGLEQIPPIYSAVHIGGRRAYELARAGHIFKVAPRKIFIYELNALSLNDFRVRCSTGTYVRSLARDIGAAAGGYLCTVDMIRRISTNGFSIKDAVSLENLEKMYNNDHDSFMGKLLPVDFGLDGIPVLGLGNNDAKLFKNGGFISVPGEFVGARRIYSNGQFIGIGNIEGSVLKPKRLLI